MGKIPEKAVSVTGEDLVSVYDLLDTSSGMPKEKAFCKLCATPLWTVPGPSKGKYRNVRLSYLEGGEQLQPQREIFIRTRPAWLPGLPKAEQLPFVEEEE